MASIYRLSWDETSFLAKLKLFVKSQKQERRRIRSTDMQTKVAGYSALSSTYYSIAGTAFAQLRATLSPIWLAPILVPTWCLTWLPLAAWCYWRMLPLSNQTSRLIGHRQMLANQLDIRQSILRRRGRYNEAMGCIEEALRRPPNEHTHGLLLVGLADCYLHQEYYALAEGIVRQAIQLADAATGSNPRQAARIYRGCANISNQLNLDKTKPDQRAKELLKKARALAEQAGAADQMLKL